MKIQDIAKKFEQDLIGVRHHLHKHPELSTQEVETTKFIETYLNKFGIQTQTFESCTGLLAVINPQHEGKTLALRGDMDALPITECTGLPFASNTQGVMHACGHDIHTSVLLGAALVLNEMRDQVEGTVKFIFQPSEERTLYGISGAKEMIQNGVLENKKVDAILGLHCWPELSVGQIGVRKGAMMAASDSINITIKGRGGHAAHPHKAVDAIVVASSVVSQVQTLISREVAPVDSAVITFGAFQAGKASNVIAGEATLQGTMRTINPATRERLTERLKEKVQDIAKSYGAQAQVQITRGNGPVINDSQIIDRVCQAVTEKLDESEIVELMAPSLGSEDFSNYLEKTQGAFIRLGTNNDNPSSKLSLHNPQIIFDDGAIYHGVCTMSAFTLAYFKQK